MRLVVAMFLVLFSGFSYASNFPGICDESTPYTESSVFVRGPASVAGCIGGVIGVPIGFVIGIPIGEPVGGGYITALLANRAFNSVLGAPFYVIEYIPRKIFTSSKDAEDNKNSTQ